LSAFLTCQHERHPFSPRKDKNILLWLKDQGLLRKKSSIVIP
jgi:hypothetical protein